MDGCTCHLSPPCSFCTSLDKEEMEAYINGGIDALEKLRIQRAEKSQEILFQDVEETVGIYNKGIIENESR